MTIEFYKFEGSGNDFIIIDQRKDTKNFSNSQIRKLCDRRFGIGADGLMLYNPSRDYDFEMKYYNADGNEGSMCGNGGRCLLAFSDYLNSHQGLIRFIAIDGEHQGKIIENLSKDQWSVKLKMSDVSKIIKEKKHYEIDTGSPHYITFRENIEKINVFDEGKNIRYSAPFSDKGINVNFVEQKNKSLFVRTYERGVENETLSCGTGVTASALAFAMEKNLETGNVAIQTLGGNLSVDFNKEGDVFKNIWLTGPVTFVFKGTIDI